MESKTIISNNLKQTQRFASDFAKALKKGDILCLYGNLGSGKTSFVQGLAKGLGITQRIISPTFIIARRYEIGDLNLYHIDLYRIQTIYDLQGIGIDEILKDDENITAIEWAEKLFDLMPSKRIDLQFEYINETTRKIVIKKS